MREEDLVVDYIKAQDWYYDEIDTWDVQEVGGVYQVPECSSGYKYGTQVVTPTELMVWLHERLLKLEGK